MKISFSAYRQIIKSINQSSLMTYKPLLETNDIIYQSTYSESNINDKKELSVEEIHDFLSIYQTKNYPKVTCGIITFNEERCIERCLKSISNEVDEVILVDSGSTDNTVNIVKEKFPHVSVYVDKWNGSFSSQRNIILDKSSNDWVLFLDADEYLDNSHQGKLKDVIKVLDFLPYNDFCVSPIIVDSNGYEYDSTKRIFNKQSNIRYHGKVHEEPILTTGDIPEQYQVNIRFHHDGYSPEVKEAKQKSKRNLTLVREMLILEPENPKWMFFYAKALQEQTDTESQIQAYTYLMKTIDCYTKRKADRFLFMSLILICQYCLQNGKIKEMKFYLNLLKEKAPNCADIGYFELSLYLLVNQFKMKKLIDDLQEVYIEANDKVSYLHTSKAHLYHIAGLASYQIGEINNSINFFNKIPPSTMDNKETEFLLSTYKKLEEYLKIKNKI
ncbi:glycosyltransferase [Bacillus sp. ISL-57]|uniref:glycosyltransferase n=1 Tax=Bacillus sp. ISL-57 TaxID=2819135 RepID=UPI001BE6E04A|nr:glycosyltransferase [Bacillus sp. ISL-57]MBT2717480.1 glycosyltransferase [Bacillus sp. ISL-57]